MRKIKLFLTTLLLVTSTYADTKPVHFDIGDIAPRQKITFDVNIPQWPGYHDIQCDIIDPSGAAIIRISSDDSIAEEIDINQTKYYSLPIQIALKEQQNQLTLYKTYNWSDLNNGTNIGSNNITFENLDDDVTISVKNCEISPNAILSADFIYFPSKITCAGGTCKMEGGSTDKWDAVAAADGTYFFMSAIYYDDEVSSTYYTSDFLSYVQIHSKNYIPVIKTGSSWVQSQPTEMCSPQSFSVANCPLKNK